MQKFKPSINNHAAPNECQKRRPNRTEGLIAVPGSTGTFSRLNGKHNIKFCAFFQESQEFEGRFFVISSNLVLASEWTTSWNQFVLQSIDFDRFMTSEGTYHREDIFKHFIGLIIDPRHKGFSS